MNNKSFIIIELLVVIGIIIFIGAIVVVNFSEYICKQNPDCQVHEKIEPNSQSGGN